MFNPQPKPQFHTYPLRTNQLSKLTQQMSQIDHEIYQNRKQIQQINKKFVNEQNQNTYVQRLHQKTRILQLKKQQLQNINKMHQYHQNVQTHEKKISKSIHVNLVNQYKQQIQQNLRRKSQDKNMENLKDKQLLDSNIKHIQRIETEKQRKRQQMYKVGFQQNKGIHEYHSNVKHQNRENDKKQFHQFISQTQPTQKQSAFEQYYKKNQLHSDHLQKVYKYSTQPLNVNRINNTTQVQSRNQLQYIQNLQKKAFQQQQRKAQNRDSLKQYLENQIQHKSVQKHNQASSKFTEDLNRRNSLVDNERYELEAKQNKKMSQYLYSTELAKQYNDQVQVQRQNGLRSKQHTYTNQSSDALVSRRQVNSPQSPKSGIFLGNQKNRMAAHNPLTNPIPFSIGMTNPYVLKQYQSRRASSNFKASNLAQLGDQSFRN